MVNQPRIKIHSCLENVATPTVKKSNNEALAKICETEKCKGKINLHYTKYDN